MASSLELRLCGAVDPASFPNASHRQTPTPIILTLHLKLLGGMVMGSPNPKAWRPRARAALVCRARAISSTLPATQP